MERLRRIRPVPLRGAVAAAALSLALAAGSAGAHEAHGHPARLHVGTCDALGAVAFPLTGVGGSESPDGTPIATLDEIGPVSTFPVVVSETMVAAALADIVAGGHAINVYESDEAMDTAIACGNVGGVVLGDELIVGMGGVNESGHAGIAVLRDEGAQMRVRIYLGEAMAQEHADGEEHEAGDEHEEAAGTPVASR